MFRRKRQGVCSTRCEMARRKAAGVFAKIQARSIAARMAYRPMTLAGFGLLTPREQAIYQRGRVNGQTYARQAAYLRGRRAGWAEALGERGAA